MALSVAVQVYSVRDFAEKDMRGTLQKIKDMGYDGVEFAGLYGNSAEDVKAMCEEIGLIPISAHVALADAGIRQLLCRNRYQCRPICRGADLRPLLPDCGLCAGSLGAGVFPGA